MNVLVLPRHYNLPLNCLRGQANSENLVDHPDGAEGPHKLANKSQKPQAAEGHNPYARRKSKDHGKHVIVASEPSTYRDQDWVLIEKNHIILVGPAGDIKLTKMEC